jgi:hypothetical protein
MIAKLIDFVHEYPFIIRSLDARSKVRYIANTILCSPLIFKEGKLAPVDRRMNGDVSITYRGRKLHFPIGRIEASLANTNDSPTFSALREMFFNDVYLWPFKPFFAEQVMDLGANRYFFGVIAVKVLGAKLYIAVEPLRKYDTPREMLFSVNDILQGSVRIYQKLLGLSHRDPKIVQVLGGQTNNTITVSEIVEDIKIKAIDFLKVDIEGAEYDVFEDTSWLSLVSKIAMELHPPASEKVALFAKLQRAGFSLLCTDTHRATVKPEIADYLFASRDPNAFVASMQFTASVVA